MTQYIGLNKTSGSSVSNTAHLQQSVGDILTTPIGSRVMRRDYGSPLFALVDQPANASGLMRLKAACADALLRWEKRLRLSKITVVPNTSGKVTLTITGKIVELDQEITITQGV